MEYLMRKLNKGIAGLTLLSMLALGFDNGHADGCGGNVYADCQRACCISPEWLFGAAIVVGAIVFAFYGNKNSNFHSH
jgi:hypothetical protein